MAGLVATPEQEAQSRAAAEYVAGLGKGTTQEDFDALQRITNLLTRNNSKRFVKRIIFPEASPVAPDDEDPESGRVMTHKMAWGEADGKFYVFPTVMEDENGTLRNYGPDAFREAIKRRDFMTFDNPKDADWFSQNYKRYWDHIGFKPGAR